ncbi:MAG: 4Fe-4S ferredoxin [Campylobacter sp.]|nr:4Fe-4S ferredoxin [Campylobacter sp.]
MRFKKASKIPPPYFGGEFDCKECEKLCVINCPREVLKSSGDEVEFLPNQKGCNFCEICAQICPENVLNLANGKFIKAKTTIKVNVCLAWNSVVCYNCFDACKFKGIEYLGMFRPVINSNCVNCSECVGVCFVNAIEIKGCS